jgi:hypothetical protein
MKELSSKFGSLDGHVQTINESMGPWATNFEDSLERVSTANEMFASNVDSLASRLSNIEGQIANFNPAPPRRSPAGQAGTA